MDAAAGRHGPKDPGSPEGDDELLFPLRLAGEAVSRIRSRHRLTGDEAEELDAFVKLRLLENDRKILRCFQGRSRLETYLTVVVQRLFVDFRNARWGRWRPSRAALREGPTALLLERLLHRDGLTFDQAVAAIRGGSGPAVPLEEIHRLRDLLPPRPPRVAPGPPGGEAMRDGAAVDPERAAIRREQGEEARRAAAVLRRLVEVLPEEDRLALTLRFSDGLTVSSVARLIGREPAEMHRRFPRLLERLRERLAAEGIRGGDVLEALSEADSAAEAAGDSDSPAESHWLRPSRPPLEEME